MISYNMASATDWEAIRSLLETNNLPFSDLSESPISFFVARDDEKIVGCIGLEIYENTGLLRSFAVTTELQNMGIGKELYKNLLEYAGRTQIESLHLLTTTAREYFSRIGYRQADRNRAPAKIAGSAEFAGLCPVSSTYMVLDTIS
jgi:amino-acid N-acetyltransferase